MALGNSGAKRVGLADRACAGFGVRRGVAAIHTSTTSPALSEPHLSESLEMPTRSALEPVCRPGVTGGTQHAQTRRRGVFSYDYEPVYYYYPRDFKINEIRRDVEHPRSSTSRISGILEILTHLSVRGWIQYNDRSLDRARAPVCSREQPAGKAAGVSAGAAREAARVEKN